ncbi:ABC transporter substrate-binding protein [Candidatus Aerophobetes bacterium]|nr:ABC transporter substrate-binding protein [Candidatus Aerophobetes bacterium]
MFKKKLLSCILVGLFMVVVTGSFLSVQALGQKKEPIRIGAVLTLSSIIPLINQEQKRGFEVAVDKVGGEIQGRPIELYFADVSSLESAKSEALRLIQLKGCKVIIGSGIDDFDGAMSSICERNKVIFWMTLAGGPILTKPGQKYTFRTNPWSTLEGTAQADWFVNYILPLLGIERSKVRAAVLHLDSAWGTQMSSELVRCLEEKDIKVVFNKAYSEETTRTMAPVVLKIKSLGANVFFAPGMFPKGARLFWEAAKTLDFNPLVAIGTGGFLGTGYAKDVLGNLVNGFCSTNWPVENTNPKLSPGMQEFVQMYKKKYGEEHLRTCHSASAYTGMLFLLDALKRAKNLDDVDSIVEAIRKTDIPPRKIGNGWGCKFAGPDEWNNGTNLRAFEVGVQWQDGQMWTIYPMPYPGRKLELPMLSWKDKEKIYQKK